MNLEIFRLVNNFANENRVLDSIMIFFSKDVMYIFMAVTAILYLLGIKNNNLECRKSIASTLIFTIINLCISFIIGGIFYEDRPFVNNKVNLLYQHAQNASFPSDHAIGTMSIGLGMRKYNKSISRILMILSVIIGVSRLYVGHHYPLDIIGAYVLVFVVSYIYNLLLRNRVELMYEKFEKNILKLKIINA